MKLNKKEREVYKKPEIGDGLLEVVAIEGTIHLGKIQAGTSSGIVLGQGSLIEMATNAPLPFQVDGEPWQQKKSVVTIKHFNKVKMLVKQGFVWK